MNYPVIMPSLFYDLLKRVEIVSDPGCLRRMSRQPGKGSLDRFHNSWVWYCNFVRALEKKGVVQMAKVDDQKNWKGFINVRLSDADKETLAADDNTSITGLIDSVAGLLYAGYKLGFAYDKTSGSVQATLTCWSEGHPDYGHAISARHPDFDRALHSLVYKHFVIAHECWTDFAPPAPVTTWD